MKKKKKQSPVRKWIERIIFVIALCVFIYAAFNLYTIFKANSDEKAETDRVRELVEVPKSEEDLDNFKIDFKKLQAINPEIVAWIVVKDTDINYPVVKGSDNDFYLTHTFEKKENYAGAIFMNYANDPNLRDLNTFIYGHNVFHGTMFAELENYTKEAFFKDHPYVYLYTPEANYKLQVVSAYVAEGDSDSHKIGFANSDDYQNYINYVKGLSRFDSGVEMSAEDHMVTLYTCSYENGTNPGNSDAEYIKDRYFIHTKIIKALSGEMPYEQTTE